MSAFRRRLSEPSSWAGLSVLAAFLPDALQPLVSAAPEAAGAVLTGNWFQLIMVLGPAVWAILKSEAGNGGGRAHPAQTAGQQHMDYTYSPGAPMPPAYPPHMPSQQASHAPPVNSPAGDWRRVQNFTAEPPR